MGARRPRPTEGGVRSQTLRPLPLRAHLLVVGVGNHIAVQAWHGRGLDGMSL
jgi:hypothetical protein